MSVSIENLNLFYGDKKALDDISLTIPQNQVTAFIGPSGCGKSSLLRCINRMNDLIDNVRIEGEVFIDDSDIYAPKIDVVELRTRVGMVFQKPNPFPMSIFDNVAYGPRLHGFYTSKADLKQQVQTCLEKAGLWDDVKDRLQQSASSLSGGQQQRLCIARTIAVKPNIILMDEPCSALDPIATAKVEELIDELRQNYTIVIVTHSLQQAARISQKTAFFHTGTLVEAGPTDSLFTSPKDDRTLGYITGRYG